MWTFFILVKYHVPDKDYIYQDFLWYHLFYLGNTWTLTHATTEIYEYNLWNWVKFKKKLTIAKVNFFHPREVSCAW